MPDPLLSIERRDDGVVALRLTRPPLNALSRALLGELAEAAEAAATDATVKAVVVLGSERALAAGADIAELEDRGSAQELIAAFRRAFHALGAIPRPVIAGIRGFALGGGLELALACDLRVAGESARLGVPEILLGVIPGAGGTQRLARLLGPARAKELVWSGRQVKAPEALALGLVDRVVADDDVDEATLDWASSFAGGAVVAMGLAKRAIDDGLDGALAAGLDGEAQAFLAALATEDAATGLRSFLEHGPGKARFSGR